jgi:hypothetical protein
LAATARIRPNTMARAPRTTTAQMIVVKSMIFYLLTRPAGR